MEIQKLIDDLTAMQALGATDVFCRDRCGKLDEVREVCPGLTRYDDGKRVAVQIAAVESPNLWRLPRL